VKWSSITGMTPELWKQVEEIFQAALDRAPEQRAAFIVEACAGNASLREHVEALIASHERAGSFIEAPIFAIDAATLIGLPPDAQTGSMTGKRIGAYRIVREVGRGGMGAVYLAERADEAFQKRAAIKLVKRGMDTDFILRRFRHERQILANFDHPNIARLLDGGTTEDDLPYFVMEYVEGQPITRFCDDHRLSIYDRLRLFRQVCAAVSYAHQKMVVHRDIKPGNILVTNEGVPKLLDFGIAKILDPELAHDTLDPTTGTMRLLTPDYASPEQVRGELATVASDIYSLGVLLYELVTGHRPYYLRGRLPHEIARIICEEDPERPSAAVMRTELVPASNSDDQKAITPELVGQNRSALPDALRDALAGDLDSIILKAMCKQPHRRYASVEQFAEDIRRHLEGLPVSAPQYFPAKPKETSAGETSTGEPTTGSKSLAVLPLKLLGTSAAGNTEDMYLGIGLADALITRLSNIRSITVRPTSSVVRYASRTNDPLTAGRELDVGYVLDGHIQKAGGRIRVTVQLVSVRDGAPLWAAQFDEKDADILSLQDSLSAQVAQALVPRLTGEERERLARRGTESAEAYEAYLRGRYHANSYTEDGLARSITFFYKAVAIDPNFAAAYAGIADYYNLIGVWGVMPPGECFAAAKEAARKAVDLDDTLAEAFTSLAFATWAYDWDAARAEQLFRRAIELNPNYPVAHERYALLLSAASRHTEAVAQIRHAQKIDPHSPSLAMVLGFALYNARRTGESSAQTLRALELDPNNYLALHWLSLLYAQNGMYREAVSSARRAVEISGRSPLTLCTLGCILARAGDAQKARDTLDELEAASAHRYVAPYYPALIHTALGDHDRAFERLRRSSENRDWWMLWLRVEPRLDPLRADPRFEALLQQVTPTQTAHPGPATAESRRHAATTGESALSPDIGARQLRWAALAIAAVALAALFLYLKTPPQPGTGSASRRAGLARLTNNTANDIMPDWSPDGRQIVFASNRDGKLELYVMNASDGSDARRLTFNSADESGPAWSPDGARILYTNTRDGESEIYVMNADGSNQLNLTNHPGQDSRPAWSPDGHRIVFASNRDSDAPDNLDIYVMNADGSNVTRLTDDPALESDASWSPDGSHIVFVRAQSGRQFDIFLMNADGSNQINLTRNPANDNVPVWSPDGRWIAFASNRDISKQHDIYVMNADGSGVRRLTSSLATDTEPAWSPDSRRIVFQSDRNGNTEVYVTDIKGELETAWEASAETGLKSIAVLPFKTEDARGDDAYLGVGLADVLAGKLGQISGLAVRPASAVRRYLDTAQDLPQIGRELRVHYVLSGSIKHSGDRVAVEVTLTGVDDGSLLWAEKYDEKFTDIASVQNLISERVSKALRLELTNEEQQRLSKRYTGNSQAYQLYLVGRYHWGKRTASGLKQAIDFFEQAIAKDRSYALAYAGLADCYALLNWYVAPPPPDAFPRARQAAARALALDDQLAEAHASLAFYKLYYERDWTGAEREFRRAIELNPSYATAHHWYAFNLSAMGRHDEALGEIRRAQELDPRSPIISAAVANALYYARQYDDAISQGRRTLEIDPGFVPAHTILRWSYEKKGLYDEAFAAHQKERAFAGDSPTMRARLAHVYAAAGQREVAIKLLAELEAQRRRQWVSAYEIAVVYALLDERDRAFNWLARAAAERAIGFTFAAVDPDLDQLRADARFAKLLQQ
jgi:Tol biopolymer transport system component/serine/threonine protein kinase/tetratricopeptide (TPR) repeat protein